MSVPQRWRIRIERALFAPKTVELQPLQALLPEVAAQGVRLARRTDSELTAEARALRGSCHERLSQADMVAACSLAREAAHRGLGERPFDVQILGALAMLSGQIAEMATGEGKTLAAAVAAFGHVLRGEPVHVLTVNDYLARRDAEWMAPV